MKDVRSPVGAGTGDGDSMKAEDSSSPVDSVAGVPSASTITEAVSRNPFPSAPSSS